MKRLFLLFVFLTIFSVMLISCGSNNSDTELFGGGLSRDTVDFDEENSQVNLTVAETLPSCVWYESGYCF